MIKQIKAFCKKEIVLCISAFCALITMFLVPPDKEYLNYIDFRVLCILFCLMAVVGGFKSVGVFSKLTGGLLKGIKNGRILGITLVLLPFFSSMLVTNDVALIVFVPFTIALLTQLECSKATVTTIVLQTVAANLGSMATPVGNPQNLFIYSSFNLRLAEFSAITNPLTIVSLAGLTVSAFFLLPEKLKVPELKQDNISDKKLFVICTALFLLSLLAVFRILPYQLIFLITAATIAFVNPKLFKEVDFILLITFVCFFVISENLGRVEAVREFLQQLLLKSTFLTGIATSQIISNVPSAVLLSGFTDNWQELLAGVNIGGLGTPVASLASLITLKLYLKSPEAKIIKFLAVFTLANIIGLALLVGVYSLI